MRNAFTPDQLAWIEALESGEYEQGNDQLRRHGKFCCLGVAAHLANPNHPKLECGVCLPLEFVQLYRLRDDTGKFCEPWEEYNALMEANDNGKTFAEIAAFMREKPWAVFANFDAPS